MLLKIASKSLLYRKGSVILTTLALCISMFIMFSVEHIREQSKVSFASSVSGVDLIVGTRTSELNLLLYSVFRMGKPTSNMSWQSYTNLKNNPSVKWSIPLSLGDSHRGYRVLGTTIDYFTYFSYGEKQPLTFSQGKAIHNVFDVVLGAQVAKKLNYHVGDSITLSHGIGRTSFTNHKDVPFNIVGILEPTGTKVDQTIHVSLQGLEVVHLPTAKRQAFKDKNPEILINDNSVDALQPNSVTAVMVGLTSRMRAFQFQRKVNTSTDEPLLAILPGVALSELWQTLSVAENTLRLVSSLVMISTLFGLSAMLLSSIRERQQEIKLLRMIGASPLFIYLLIELEALLITVISTLTAFALLFLVLTFSKTFLLAEYGLYIKTNIFSANILMTVAILFVLTLLAAFPPAFMAFKEAKRK